VHNSKATYFRFLLYVVLAAVFTVLASTPLQHYLQSSQNKKSLAAKYELDVQNFYSFISEVSKSTELQKTFIDSKSSSNSKKYFYELWRGKVLLSSNTQRVLPHDSMCNQLIFASTEHHNYVLYNFISATDGLTYKFALPLNVVHASNNELLQSKHFTDETISPSFTLDLKKAAANAIAVNANGVPLFYINQSDRSVIQNVVWWQDLLPILFLLLALGCTYGAAVLAKHLFNRNLGLAMLILFFFFTRLVNYFFDWPINRLDNKLFSAELYAFDSFNRSIADLFLNVMWLAALFSYILFRYNLRIKASQPKWKHFAISVVLLTVFNLINLYFGNSIFELFTSANISFDVSLFNGLGWAEALAFFTISVVMGIAFAQGAILNRLTISFTGMRLQKNIASLIVALGITIFYAKYFSSHFNSHSISFLVACALIILICATTGAGALRSPFTATILLWTVVCSVIIASIAGSISNANTATSLSKFAKLVLPQRDLSLEQKLALELDKVCKISTDSNLQLNAEASVSGCLGEQDNFIKVSLLQKSINSPSILDSVKSNAEQSPFSENLHFLPTKINGLRFVHFIANPKLASAAIFIYSQRYFSSNASKPKSNLKWLRYCHVSSKQIGVSKFS
jgi:hypothetical protein